MGGSTVQDALSLSLCLLLLSALSAVSLTSTLLLDCRVSLNHILVVLLVNLLHGEKLIILFVEFAGMVEAAPQFRVRKVAPILVLEFKPQDTDFESKMSGWRLFNFFIFLRN